jgi:putative endonuclease
MGIYLIVKMERSWVYILTNKDNNVLYTGVTSNLEERIRQHRDKHFGGFTGRYNLTKVVYFEELPNIQDAIYREKQIKRLPRRRKILLIERVNPFWEELLP